MISPAQIERLLHYMPHVVSSGDEWERGFAKSVLRQSRRRGWTPSEKQIPIMQEMVNDLFRPIREEGGSFDVIES